jgi:hypothetical protein
MRSSKKHFTGSPKPRVLRRWAKRYTDARFEAGKAWRKAWLPYRRVLMGLKLPPRGKVGCENNIRRNMIVCQALHA